MTKLAFCPSIGPFDFECDVEVEVVSSRLIIINAVYEHSDKANLFFSEDKLLQDLGYRIADMAERDPELLARAVEQDEFERAA